MTRISARLWLCACCALAATNDDTSGHDHYCQGKREPLSWGHVMVTNDHDQDTGRGYKEHAAIMCDGCGDDEPGTRYRYAVMDD